MDRQFYRAKCFTTIDYKALGTVSVSELSQALWVDIKALGDLYNVRYVTGARLIIPSTNEYGDPVVIRHPEGHIARRLDTHHYRPACLDYQL